MIRVDPSFFFLGGGGGGGGGGGWGGGGGGGGGVGGVVGYCMMIEIVQMALSYYLNKLRKETSLMEWL